MRTGRSYVATAVALGIITLSGCAAETADEGAKPGQGDDWGDADKYPELGGAFHSLTAYQGACTFVSGTMTVTATAAVDQSIIIGKRAVDSAILVNGALLPGCTTVTSATLKSLKVTATTGNQVVILDFLGGVFAPGIATARGITVDLGANTDELRIRGTSQVDSWVFGSDGLAINTDAFRDIDIAANIETLNFSLGAGNDVLTGTVVPNGLGAGKGVAASATVNFTAFGGDGNDVITGGLGADVIYGGTGADTLSGGGTGTLPASGAEVDWLAGQEGADVITQGADANGKDVVACGTELAVDGVVPALADTVTYALRGTAAVRTGTEATLPLIQAVDGDRVTITIVPCVDTTPADGACDTQDAKGFDVYPVGNTNGYAAESAGSLVGGVWTGTTLTATEGDSIASDCETLIGGMDNDIIVGGPGNETLTGGVGDDTITGGLGDDVLNGDEGADVFRELTADSGSDTINGGTGVDLVDYSGRGNAIEVTMDGLAANDGESGEEDSIEADVDNLLGTAQADKITGNALNNVLTGGAGVDELDGAAGDDTFDEGVATNAGDTFTGGLGIDTVDYSKRALSVWVTMGDDTANDGQVTYTAVVAPGPNTPNLPARVVNTQATILNLESVASLGTSFEADNVKDDVENVLGSLVADDITGNDSANLLEGGPGADFLFGGDGDDVLFGGIAGAAFNEVTSTIDIEQDGDTTNAAVATPDGNDFLYGGLGADTLDGSAAAGNLANKLVCGGGDDVSVNQGTTVFNAGTGAGAFRDPASCES